MTLHHPQRYDHTNAQQHGSNNKKFNKVITKCYNKNACSSKITMRRVTGNKKSTIGGLRCNHLVKLSRSYAKTNIHFSSDYSALEQS